MNTFQRDVLTLIKSAITQTSLKISDSFDMQQAVDAMEDQHLTTVLYDGAVRCGVQRNLPVMQEQFRHYCQMLRKSDAQMREVERIIAVFEANAIDYMPIKGCKMKALYPKPELRFMGDADILIREEQYPQIIPLIQELGFTLKNNHHHTFNWYSSGLFLELHRCLFPASFMDYCSFLGDGWSLAERQEGTRYSWSPENEWLFIFTHFAKHYQCAGIGCCHVADMWMFLRAHPEMDDAYISSRLKEMHLLEFYKNVRDLIKLWFEDGADNEVLQCMTDYIFANGSWGKKEYLTVFATARKQKESESTFTSRMKYFFKILFPSLEALQPKYTVLQKAPWLLPLVWIYRLPYKLFTDPSSLKEHNKELGTLTQDRLDKTRYMLEFVGLKDVSA